MAKKSTAEATEVEVPKAKSRKTKKKVETTTITLKELFDKVVLLEYGLNHLLSRDFIGVFQQDDQDSQVRFRNELITTKENFVDSMQIYQDIHKIFIEKAASTMVTTANGTESVTVAQQRLGPARRWKGAIDKWSSEVLQAKQNLAKHIQEEEARIQELIRRVPRAGDYRMEDPVNVQELVKLAHAEYTGMKLEETQTLIESAMTDTTVEITVKQLEKLDELLQPANEEK